MRRAGASRFAWVDGRVLPAARATVSALDRGLLFGDAFFETARVHRGRPLLWSRHERRLRATLRRFGVAPPPHDLRAAIAELLAACRLEEAAVRVTVTRGTGDDLLPRRGLRPTVIVTARPLPPDLEARRRDGVRAILLPFGQGAGRVAAGHKHANYLPAVLGRSRAARAGAEEAIYVEADGTVSEATTSNVFAVLGRRLVTPPAASGCLPGITRALVLELARGAGLDVREEPLPARGLGRAREIFLAGSIVEVLPVVRLDGRPVGDGRPGPVASALRDACARRLRGVARPRAATPPRRSGRAAALGR